MGTSSPGRNSRCWLWTMTRPSCFALAAYSRSPVRGQQLQGCQDANRRQFHLQSLGIALGQGLDGIPPVLAGRRQGAVGRGRVFVAEHPGGQGLGRRGIKAACRVPLRLGRHVVHRAQDVVGPESHRRPLDAIAVGEGRLEDPIQAPSALFHQLPGQCRVFAAGAELGGQVEHRIDRLGRVDEPWRQIARIVPAAVDHDPPAVVLTLPVLVTHPVHAGNLRPASLGIEEVQGLADRAGPDVVALPAPPRRPRRRQGRPPDQMGCCCEKRFAHRQLPSTSSFSQMLRNSMFPPWFCKER